MDRGASVPANNARARAGGSAGNVSVGLDISQWKYLPAEQREAQMQAILTVEASGTGDGGGSGGPTLAQVLVVDCSGSMAYPQEKLRAAHQAAVAALRMLPDGTPFAVVQGTQSAAMVHPTTGTMAWADRWNRSQAEQAVHQLMAGGGTCIGSWLDLARRLLAEVDAPIGHVLLLTDGKNQHDEVMPLTDVLEACAGRFVCDAWGIGDGWDARELLRITGRLHGQASSVRDEADLPREYEQLMRGLLAKNVPELVITVKPMPGAEVRYLKQVFPTEMELTAVGTDHDGTRRFVTRAWGDEARRYQLCLSADPAGRPQGEDLQLAVVSLDVPGGDDVELTPPLPCLVHWTDDPRWSRQSNVDVDHFKRHQRVAEAVRAATDAYNGQKRDLAEEHLGRAVRLAHAIGPGGPLDWLAQLVEILDAEEGRVRLRPGVAAVDFEHVLLGSVRSVYTPVSESAGGTAAPDAGPDVMTGGAPVAATVPCPKCEQLTDATARFCSQCRHPLQERP